MTTRRTLERGRIELREHETQLEKEILLASEREQQRIGRDLHDSLGAHLAAVGYAATFLANELRHCDLRMAAQLDSIREMVAEATSLTRELARGLFPVQTSGPGLSRALEELAAATSRLTGMVVSFHQTGAPVIKDAEEGLHLYRITQEALSNASKHGHAGQVTLVLSRSQDCLRLAVADDGQGMPAEPTGREGIGLHSMHYRARALGGELKLESSPGFGTIVSCEIPTRSPRPAAPAP